MTHGEAVGELRAGTLQRRSGRAASACRAARASSPSPSSVNNSRSVNSGIVASSPASRLIFKDAASSVEIARNGIALKRERRRVMDIAHQQIEGGTQSRSDEIT